MTKTLLDGFGEATDEVVALRAEVERLAVALGKEHTESERLRAIVEAARKARAITGSYNQHTANCQNCPCDVCEDFFDLEQDAEHELDMELQKVTPQSKEAPQ